MISIAICDDNLQFGQALNTKICKYLATAGFSYETFVYGSGKELIHALNRGQQMDVLFLDIKMPNMDGKELAEQLRRRDDIFKLIFVSSHEKEVFEVFKLDTFDFIQKRHVNIQLDSVLRRLLERLRKDREELNTYVIFEEKEENTLLRLRPSDILYISTMGRESILHTRSGKGTYNLGRKSMDELEKDLSQYGLYRVNRQALVNLDYVRSLRSNSILLDDGTSLPISRRRKADFEVQYFTMMAQK